MLETFHQTADAGDSLSVSGCRRLSIRHWIQEYLHQTAIAGVYQTAYVGDFLSESGCRRPYQTADA